jgi:hypothetical protein
MCNLPEEAERYTVVLNVPSETFVQEYSRQGLQEYLAIIELGVGDEVTIIREA